ncbi:Uma2 family endonuclease [Streptomyces sp. MST-110588]|nr:Uma2 family endonuclease [Streptomyces sp. MST-110588]
MSTDGRPAEATPETWMHPPGGRWTYDQVKDLDLPFDWELVDGVISVRGMTPWWHDQVRDQLLFRFRSTVAGPAHWANIARCVMLDDFNVVKPDLVVFDLRGLDPLTLECTPADKVRLAVEVTAPGSAVDDRTRKPALFAAAGVPYFWRVERGEDDFPEVHEFWLSRDVGVYVPAPEHPRHMDKLETDRPFPISIDLTSLLEL